MNRLYIITDARGYTICCDGTHDAMHRAAAFHLLLAPLTVHDWYRTSEPTPHGGWVKKEVFTWPA